MEKNSTSINVDLDVYKIIEKNRISFEETHNDILKRLIAVNDGKNNLVEIISKTVFPKDEIITQSGDWVYHNVHLPEGTKLMKWLKGVKYEAEIKSGAFYFGGKYYKTPSAAGMAVTEGSNVNGWDFWRFYDESVGRWKRLRSLRDTQVIIKAQ